MDDATHYVRSSQIMKIAMGSFKEGPPRRRRTIWNADPDPLGYWMGVEAIVGLVQSHGTEPPAKIGAQ